MDPFPVNERDLFIAAMQIDDPAKRSALLDTGCGADAELRVRVEVLLQAFAQAGSFMQQPAAFAATSAMPTDGTRLSAVPAEVMGTVIGPYKLMQQIGEGGMGTVYMAEQTHPVQRRVALKLIKPGMDSRQVIARFEAERQALALMDHVNIARVLDAGATEAGRPYFVMELVHGVPITVYCNDNHLTPRERLELFVPVCQAIQHAHQKGIIHRDVKPSNVMITLYDGKPVPKVIDFGVAKATEQTPTERTLFTQYGTMVGTLEYMSPEQAEMSVLGVDTRSDIYSLGVLLYELLTGSTPLTRKRLKEAAFDEVLRMIKEEEPPTPSTRLSDSGEALASISAQRQMEPAKLAKLVRGELDWIVMKTLEKDRNRRYETANGVAADVQRYLNDEAVQACPPSVGYRFHKFARRNKAALLTATLISATLIAAMVLLSVSYLQLQLEQKRTAGEYIRAEVEKGLANRERGEAESRLQLVLEALDEIFVKEAETLVTLRQRTTESQAPADPQREQAERNFLEKGLHFYEQLAQRPGTSAEAQLEMGRALRSIAIIRLRLGHFLESERALRQAAQLFEKLRKRFPDVTEYAIEQADACQWLYTPLTSIGRNEEAEEVTREALAIFEKTALKRPSELRTRKGLAICHDYLARLQLRTERLADAMCDFELADKFYAQLAKEFPLEAEYRGCPAHLRLQMAPCLTNLGQRQEAAELFGDAVAAYDKLVADTADRGSTTRNGVATTAQDNAWYRHELGYAYVWQGDLLRQLGQLPGAEAVLRHGLDVHEKLEADFPTIDEYKSRLAWNQIKLGDVRAARGSRGDAAQAYRDAIALLEQIGANDAGLGNAYEALGRFYKADGLISESLETWRKSMATWERLAAQTNDRDHRWHLAGNYWWVGTLLLEIKDTEGAVAALLKARDLWETLVRECPDSADYRLHLCETYKALTSGLASAGRQEEALEMLCKVADVADEQAHDSPQQWHVVRETHWSLADSFVATGRLQDATKAYDAAIQRKPQEPGVWGRRGVFYGCLGLWDLAARDIARSYELEPAGTSGHQWLWHALLGVQAGDLASYQRICRRLPEQFSPDKDWADFENELVRVCTIAPAAEADLGWAVRMAENGVQRHPQAPWGHFSLGLARYRACDDEGAVAALNNAGGWLSGRLVNPVLAMAYHRLGREQEARDALDSATQEIESVAEAFFRNPPGFMPMFWWDWLSCLILYHEARTVVEGVAPPDDARLIVAQARTWAALGEAKQADEACRRAVELSDQNADVCLVCATIYVGLGEWSAAKSATEEAICLKPDLHVAQFILGVASMNLGKHSVAIDAYCEAIRLKPDYAVAQNNLAWLLATCPDIALRDPARAIDSAKQAVELAPAEAGYWNTLGAAQYRAGDFSDAVETLTKAMELRAGGDASDWFFLAMVHWHRGEKQEARKWYGQAVEWMDKHQSNGEELRRFHAEAAALFESEAVAPDKP